MSIFFSLTLSSLCLDLWASEEHRPWFELETRYTVIQYPSMDILERFQKSVHFGNAWWASSSEFATISDEENRKIASLKTDAVFKRVQEILDMKKQSKKVRILLYADKTALETAYLETYNNTCPFKAWYEYKTNIISLNADDLDEGILAHELAHSIIDHFLNVRPPKNTAEILARYVDSHLK